MSSFPMEVGRVVFSKAGRDAGHYFVVVAVLDKDHVAIANGCQRKVDNPKKKKIKHLVAKPEILEEIREKIFAKKRIFDSEVRNKLDAIGYQEALLPRKEGLKLAQERQYRGRRRRRRGAAEREFPRRAGRRA